MAESKEGQCILSPKQQDCSVNPLLDVKLGTFEFAPHFLIIYWSLSDYFTYRYRLLTDGDKAEIEKIKASSASDAAWIACNNGQQAYGLEMVESSTDGFAYYIKTLYTPNAVRESKPDIAFEPQNNDDTICAEYTKCIKANQERIGGVLEDATKAIKEALKDDVSYRGHLMYGTILGLTILDQGQVSAQVDAAAKKAGDADSNYVFLSNAGNIYMQSQQYAKAIEYLKKGANIIKNDGYCRTRLFYCYCKLKEFGEARNILNALIDDVKKGGAPSDGTQSNFNGSMEEFFQLLQDYFEIACNPSGADELIVKIKSYDRSDQKGPQLRTALSYMMHGLHENYWKTSQKEDSRWIDVVTNELETQKSQATDKNNPEVKTSTYGERAIAQFACYMGQVGVADDAEDVEFMMKPGDPGLNQFVSLDFLCDCKGMTAYYNGLSCLAVNKNPLIPIKEALPVRGACFSIHIANIVALNSQGNAPDAERKINELKSLGTLPSSLNLIRINALRFAGAFKEAETELFAAIAKDPQNPSIDMCMTLSDTLCYQGKYQAALLLFGQLLAQHSDLFWNLSKDWQFRLRYALLLEANGFTEYGYKLMRLHHCWASEDSSKFGDDTLKDSFSYGVYLDGMVTLGNAAQALGISKKSGGTWHCYRRANLYFIHGKYDKAFDDAKKLLAEFENHPLGHALMARANADINPDTMEKDVENAVQRADKMFADKTLLPWMYYEVMMQCACAKKYAGQDDGTYIANAKKVDCNKAFRKLSDGSEDGRKWLIDEQYSIISGGGGDKEAIKTGMTGLLEKMKTKFKALMGSFEDIVPSLKKKKKMKDADWKKIADGTQRVYEEIKKDFIQFKWDFNKVKELANLPLMDQDVSNLDAYTFTGPPGVPKPVMTKAVPSVMNVGLVDDAPANDPPAREEEKQVVEDVVVTTGNSGGDSGSGGGGGGGGSGPAIAGGGAAGDLSKILIDSCGLQYLMQGGKAFLSQRLVANSVMNELTLLSQICIWTLQDALWSSKNFDEEKDHEPMMIFGGSKVVNDMMMMDYEDKHNKLALMLRVIGIGDKIEWATPYDGSQPKDEEEKKLFNMVADNAAGGDDFGKCASCIYYAKVGRIDEAKFVIDMMQNKSLICARTKGWFELRYCSNYTKALESLRIAFEQFEGNTDPQTLAYYLEALCSSIVNGVGDAAALQAEIKTVLQACPMDNVDVKAALTALSNYGVDFENRFDQNKYGSLFKECSDKSGSFAGKVIGFYFECGDRAKQFGSKANINSVSTETKKNFNALMTDVLQVKKINKFYAMSLVFMSAMACIKSEYFAHQMIEKFVGIFFGSSMSQSLAIQNMYQKGMVKGGDNPLNPLLGSFCRLNSIENVAVESVVYHAVDPKVFGAGGSKPISFAEDWAGDLAENCDKSLKRFEELYGEKNDLDVPFCGNKTLFLAYIDMLRLRWVGDDLDFRNKLDHNKINSLLFEYLKCFPADFNGLITAADYWISIGCVQAAYVAYNKCERYFSLEFESHLLAQLKYADILLCLGQLGASYARYKNVFHRVLLSPDDKQLDKEMNGEKFVGFVYEYFLDQYAMLCLMLGKDAEAKAALEFLDDNCKHANWHGPSGYIVESLLQEKNEFSKSIIDRAIQMFAKGLGNLEDKNQNYARFNNVDMANSVLMNVVSNGSFKSGAKINANNIREDGATLDTLEGVMMGDPSCYKTQRAEMKGVDENDLNANICKPIDVSDFPIAALKGVTEKALADYKSDHPVKILYSVDGAAAAAAAGGAGGSGASAAAKGGAKKAAKSSKPAAGGKGGKSKGKEKKGKASGSKASKKSGGSGGSGGSGASGLSTKSSIMGSMDLGLESVTLIEVESWLGEQRKSRPLEEVKASDVSQWDAKRLSQFILSVPFYKYNEKYSEMLLSKGVNGEEFLKASPAQMKLWGIKSIAHLARLRAEINHMRRRG